MQAKCRKIQDGLLKPISSSITAWSIGTRQGSQIEFAEKILSRQTFRKKSSNTWIVNCSPGQRR